MIVFWGISDKIGMIQRRLMIRTNQEMVPFDYLFNIIVKIIDFIGR